MTNDSSTGGYILPDTGSGVPPAPIDDTALEELLQSVIVGITGMQGQNVRPTWQVTPANLPLPSVDWIAFGITDSPGDQYAYEAHDPVLINPPTPPAVVPPNGYDIQIRHEDITVLVTVYGPNRFGNCKLLRDGLALTQNREALFAAGLGLHSIDNITGFPELVNNQWYRRADMPVRFRREVVRFWPILDLLSFNGTLESDTGFDRAITVTDN